MEHIKPSVVATFEIMKLYVGMHSSEIIRKSCTPFSFDKMDKGTFGKYLEIIAGCATSNDQLDCSDGDVKAVLFKYYKTFGCYLPAETMAITTNLGSLDGSESFFDNVGKKVRKVLLLGIVPDKEKKGFILKSVVMVDLDSPELQYFCEELVGEFATLNNKIVDDIENGRLLRTTSSADTASSSMLQIRPKDSRKKNGAYTSVYRNGKLIARKRYAYYFTLYGVRKMFVVGTSPHTSAS